VCSIIVSAWTLINGSNIQVVCLPASQERVHICLNLHKKEFVETRMKLILSKKCFYSGHYINFNINCCCYTEFFFPNIIIDLIFFGPLILQASHLCISFSHIVTAACLYTKPSQHKVTSGIFDLSQMEIVIMYYIVIYKNSDIYVGTFLSKKICECVCVCLHVCVVQ
jgi:hypothetical protein